jgi:hypothetical protein
VTRENPTCVAVAIITTLCNNAIWKYIRNIGAIISV